LSHNLNATTAHNLPLWSENLNSMAARVLTHVPALRGTSITVGALVLT